jgi:hypothetical protein
MQEGIDKLSLLFMVCAITIVGPRREIASLGWAKHTLWSANTS